MHGLAHPLTKNRVMVSTQKQMSRALRRLRLYGRYEPNRVSTMQVRDVMRFLLAIIVSALALPSLASNEGQLKRLSDSDFGLILRCSQAAHIAVYAAKTTPDPAGRLTFALNLQKDPHLSQKLGKGTPTASELISATLAVGALLQEGAQISTAQAHDTLVGQAAATCALQTSVSQ